MNAEKLLPGLLAALFSQKPSAPDEIILVDSRSRDNTVAIAQSHPGVNHAQGAVKVIPIEKFSHGRARNLGARAATGEIIVLMTQDALPQGDRWLSGLLAPFADGRVGAVYSRQVPKDDAPPTEKFFLGYHFPAGEAVRRVKKDSAPLSFKDVFFSNVSAAIRRELLLRHPFDENLIMSEDQQFARELLEAGHALVYQPESVVVHSHAYSLKHAFRRYFDSVYSLTVIFPRHDMATSASIGLSYLRKELAFIARNYPLYLPYYFLYTIAKAGGTVCGHFAERLPKSILKKFSLHNYHWK